MTGNTQRLQRELVKENVSKYREALENYYIKNKQVITQENGFKAFSLLSPPIASPAAKRRLRLIMNDLMQGANNSRTPHFITMAVTYDCQCDCSHCSASEYKESVVREDSALSYAELVNAVRQTIDLGASSIVFTGGEPLLYKGLYDLIGSVDKTRAICTIFTNGEYLDKQAVAGLRANGAFGVFVSFDFPDAATHDRNRGRKGIFEKAVKGIKLCQEKGILTGISTFATRQKLANGEIDAMMRLARDLNVMEVFLFDIIPTGKLSDKNSLLLEERDFEEIRRLRARYNVEPDFPRIIHQTMLTSIAFPCTQEGCPAGSAHMHIRANGDVCPCDFTPIAYGNIRNNPVKEIWQNIIQSDIYSKPSHKCRLSDPSFWSRVNNA